MKREDAYVEPLRSCLLYNSYEMGYVEGLNISVAIDRSTDVQALFLSTRKGDCHWEVYPNQVQNKNL